MSGKGRATSDGVGKDGKLFVFSYKLWVCSGTSTYDMVCGPERVGVGELEVKIKKGCGVFGRLVETGRCEKS